MKLPTWLILVISSAVSLLALGFFGLGLRPWERLTGAGEIVVAVANAKLESRPVVLRLSGELKPSAEIDVVSRLPGRLTEVKFKTGDFVNAGAEVATVSSGELTERARVVEVELKAATAQLQEREQQAATTDQQLARHQELYRRDLIARRDVEQAEIQAATARAQLELARAQLAQEQALLSQARKLQQLARIVAPVSGVVTGGLPVGAPVNQARAILAIAQIDRLKFVGEIPARFEDFIGKGMNAQVFPRDLPGEARAGRVERHEIKAGAEEIRLEISVDNRDRALAVGAVVDAAVTLAQRAQVLTIPRSALGVVSGRHFVYLIVDGRAVRRAVKLAGSGADPVAIADGLKAGDKVIAERLGEITAGARVRAAMKRE